jgi:hypothetical protein
MLTMVKPSSDSGDAMKQILVDSLDILIAALVIALAIAFVFICVKAVRAVRLARSLQRTLRKQIEQPNARPCFNRGCHRRAVTTLFVTFFGDTQPERRYFCALHADPAFSALLVAEQVKFCRRLNWVMPSTEVPNGAR